MSTTEFGRVLPGDLITSDFINGLLAKIEDLDLRVDELESHTGGGNGTGTAPKITGFNPATEVPIRGQLQILGTGFLADLGKNTVTIDGITVPQILPGSGATKLIVGVPVGITGAPKTVTVRVENDNGFDTGTIRVLPETQIPTGRVVIGDSTPSLGTITVGSTYTFTFNVTSETTIGETYDLEAQFSNVVGSSAANWLSSTSFLTPTTVTIGSFATGQASFTVTVPTGATSADVALRVKSRNNDAGLSRASAPIHLVIGSAAPVNDSRTMFVLPTPGFFSKAHKVTIDGFEGLEIPYNDNETVRVVPHMSVDGDYTYSAVVEDAGGLWTVGPLTPASSHEIAGGSENVDFKLTLTATDSSANEKRFLVFTAQRTNTDATGPFTSFVRIPIRGYVHP
jgi:hypothetical protein